MSKYIKILLSIAIIGFLFSIKTSISYAAIVSQNTLGATSSKTANQTSLVLTTTATAESGRLVVVTVARDNATTGDSTTAAESHVSSISDSAGNSYTLAYSQVNDINGTQSGAFAGVYYAVLTSQLSSGGTITVNFANTAEADATAVSAWEYAIGAGSAITVASTTSSVGDNTDALNTIISGLSSQEYLFYKGIAAETDNTGTTTATTNYTLISGATTTGNPENGNMAVAGEFRILTGTGSSSDPTLADTSNDNSSVFIAFREVLSVNLSGTIFQSDESSAFDCSTGGPYTVRVRVNNTGSYSADCTLNTGAWSVSNVAVNSGDTVYIYIYNETPKGSTVLVSDGTVQTNIPIYQNAVTLRDDASGSITNTEISTGNTADADDLISFSGSNLTVASTYETHIYTGDTYAPGTAVSTGKLHIPSTAVFTPTSNTITLTATSGTLITNAGTFTQGTSTVTVTSASGTPTLLSAATTFHNLTINSTATVINDGAAVTVNNASGAALTLTAGVLNLSTTPTGPGSGNGTLTISSGATLCLGGGVTNTSASCNSAATATTAVTMPVFQTYTFNSAGTVRYLSDAATTISSTPSYGILIFNPTLTASRVYTFDGATTISGDFTSNPTASSSFALTTNLGGTTNVATTATTTLSGTTSGTSVLDTTVSNHAFSTGLLNIASAGTLTANASTISLTGTSGTLFTRSGTFTAGTSTVQVTSSSGTPTLNSGTIIFNNLTINPSSITISSSTDALTVNGTLTIESGDTLSLVSGQNLTHSGSTLTLNGTLSGSGTYIYSGTGTITSSGTLTSNVRYDSTNSDQTISARNYGSNLELYSNSSSAVRTLTLDSGIVTVIGNLYVNAANTQNISIDGTSNNTTLDITGDLDFTGNGSGTENVTTGSGTWSVAGNIDLTGGNVTFSTGNTVTMSGSSKSLISAGNSLQNLSVSGTVEAQDTLDLDGNITINGTLDVVSGENNAITVGGNWDNDGVFESRSGTVTFNGTSGTKTIDADGTGNDAFYNIVFDDSGGSATYQLTATMDVNNDLTITGGTVDGNNQNIFIGNNYSNSDIFSANLSTVTLDATDAGNTLTGTMTGTSSFYNLTFNDGGTTGAWSFGANSTTVNNNFTISGGTVTAPSTTLTVGGSFTNNDGFTHNSGTVVFNDNSKTTTLAYSSATTFNNFTVNTTSKALQFDETDQTNITGTLTLNGSACGTKITLDSTTNDDQFALNATGSVDIDYVDIEDSNAIVALTADNATQVSNNNTNWTINEGACVTTEVNLRNGVRFEAGVQLNP